MSQLRVRFEREARSRGTLVHPNIVQVIDFGVADEAPYLVMELLEGKPLNEAIEAGIALPRAFEIARAIVSAVAYAHARRVVHRDIKPANVFRPITGPREPAFGTHAPPMPQRSTRKSRASARSRHDDLRHDGELRRARLRSCERRSARSKVASSS